MQIVTFNRKHRVGHHATGTERGSIGGSAFLLVLVLILVVPAWSSSPAAVAPALNESHSSGKLQITENREKFHFIYFAFCFFDFSTTIPPSMTGGDPTRIPAIIYLTIHYADFSCCHCCCCCVPSPRVALFVQLHPRPLAKNYIP